jgi:excinuclease ABC subunit C
MKDFAEKLKQEMKKASDLLQFEQAREIRDTLQRLGNLQTRQKMEFVQNSDEEFFGIKIQNQIAQIMTFRKINGVIRDSDKFSFDLVGDNSFSNFLFQYYTTHKIPKTIIVSQIPERKELLESMLSENTGYSVEIIVPKKGKRKEMIDLIMKNLDLIEAKGAEPSLVELKEQLGLSEIPKVIECFDISNHGEAFAVGAMSRFVGGRPDTSGYRKFKIKTVKGRDDFAMIGEIIKRRYHRLSEEKQHFPDLIVIDGGKGQLNSALKSLQAVRAVIPCISLAKENEEVYIPKRKEPLVISKNSSALKILQYARDEAHRFGVSYNRNLQLIS